MLTMCDATLVQVTGDAVDRLIRQRPFYANLSIPAHTYASRDSAVPTFGSMQTVVTTSELDDDTAYMPVKLVFEGPEGFRRSYPAFRELAPEEMHARGLSAPLHPGAGRYYRDRGWSP